MAQRSSDEQEKSANDTRTKAEELESSQHPERKSKPPGKKQDLFLEYFSNFRDAQEETKDNKPLKKDDIVQTITEPSKIVVNPPQIVQQHVNFDMDLLIDKLFIKLQPHVQSVHSHFSADQSNDHVIGNELVIQDINSSLNKKWEENLTRESGVSFMYSSKFYTTKKYICWIVI